MADIQSNIKVNIDTSNALEQIKLLQSQISAFHIQMAKGGAQAAAQAAQLRQNLVNGINATGKFSAQMTTVKTSTEYFTNALEKNKLTMGEYFRYAGGASKTFGKLFKSEFETIGKVARERVKDLQTQYIKLGRDASGAMQAIKVRPLALDMENLGTKTAIAAQKQQLLNQLLKQGSTNLLNFGKNTQWAGRQLMVGFTIPLVMFGSTAMKSFNEMEKAVVKFKRVYGDMNTMKSDTDKMVGEIRRLAESYTQYGVAIKDTMEMAATAAATGKMGADLMAQVASATKLAVLGGVDQQKGLETTISLTNAFGLSAEQLAQKIDFLNAVENQTVLSIDDLTTAIPKAAPVIEQLGGSVEDLAFFLTAMKEGGINASEGANALKSGLASLINPTNTASKMLAGFGINIKGIVEGDKGNLKKTVVDFATALNKLDPLNRAKAIEQLFGKFQFARLSTLFKNVTDQGSQAARTLELTKASAEELAIVSQREMARIAESPTFKFDKAMKDFQAAMMPIGEQFLKAATPILNFFSDILKRFDGLDDGTKGFITSLTGIVAGIGPVVLMVVGLVANGIANIIKLFANFKSFFNNLGKGSKDLASSTKYMTSEQIEAAAVAASLDQVHGKLTQTFTSEAAAIQRLVAEYQKAIAAQATFRGISTPAGTVPKAYATGGKIIGPGTGTSDSILARVSNGEAVIPASSVSRYPGLVNQLISGNVPGFFEGGIFKGPATMAEPSQYETVFGHLTEPLQTSISKLVTVLEKQGIKVPADVRKANEMGLGAGTAKLYGGLGFDTRQVFNDAMKTKMVDGVNVARGVVPKDFLQDYESRGLGKWSQSLKVAGVKLEDVSADLTKFDKSISDQIRAAATLDDKFVMTDQAMSRFTENALVQLERSGSSLASKFRRAADTPTEIRGNATQALIQSAGFVQDPENKRYYVNEDGKRVKSSRLIKVGGGSSGKSPRGVLSGASLAELKKLGELEAVAYNSGRSKVFSNPATDPYLQSRHRNSPHAQAAPDGKQDAQAYNAAKLAEIKAGLEVSDELVQQHNKFYVEEAAETGRLEGAAHSQARIAAAEAEQAELMAIQQQQQGFVAAGASTLVQPVAANYATRREAIAAEKEYQKAVDKSNKEEAKRARAEANQKRFGKFQKVGMAAMMPAMMGSMAGGQIGEISQQLMMPMMMMSMITGPVTAVIAALGLLAFGIFKVKEGYDQQIKKQVELTQSMGVGTKAMENLASYAKKATATQIMDIRRENQMSLFNTVIGKSTYGQNFTRSEEGKQMLGSIGTSLAEQGHSITTQQTASQLSAAVVNGIFTKEQALSIADNIGRELKDYNLSMNVSAQLNEMFGLDGTDLLREPLKIKARLQIVEQQNDIVSQSGSNLGSSLSRNFAEVKSRMPGGYNPFETLAHWFAANTGFNLKGDLVKQVTSYTTLVGNQLQNIQLQMDGLTVDYTNSLDEAIKNGSSPSKIKQLTDSYNSTINTLAQSQTDIYNNLVQNYKDAKDAGYYNYTMSNAQNDAITSLYKDTNQAGQAEEVKKLINNMNAADTTKLVIREAVANGTMQLADIQQYLTEYGNDAKMMSRLGIVTNKFGGNVASQTAMLSSEMNQTSANDFSKNIALSKDYNTAQNTLNAIIEARKAGGVGGVGATATIENFFGKSENFAKLKELGDDLSALKKYEEIDITVLGKVYGADEVAAITKDAKYFKGLNKNNKITYTQTFDTYYNMIGSHEFDQMYISWAAGDGKNEKDKSPTGYVAWLARQATELQKQQDALNGGGDGNGGGEVQASFLDDVVRGIRDNVKGSQRLTEGWTASKKAIQEFFKTGMQGFNGLAQMMTKNKVQDTLMQQMLGLSKEEYEAHKAELVDKYGKLTKFGEQVQRANQLVTIGNYVAGQQMAVAEIGRNVAALTKLKKAGVDAALAIELMKDKQFALAISGAKQAEVNTIVTETLKRMKAEYDALSGSEKAQKDISLYQAGLDVISDQETKINKTYDDRIKALDTVSSLNQEIAAAQQDQMDVAEALSRGDIFAAAKASKTMIANDAQRAVQASKDMLNVQREQEISNIQVEINGRLERRATLTERIADANSRIHTDTLAQLSADMVVYLTGKLPKGVLKKASGGHIVGAGHGTSDSIPAMLSNGEYVIRANAVKTIGVSTLDKLNQADRMQFSNGGMAGYAAGGLSKYADGGYRDRNNPEYWDSRRRYIMHKDEYLWMLAERFLPFQPPGTTLNDFAQQIIASNVNPNSGNPSKLSIGEHVFIPGITDVFPRKSGEPLKPSKKKKRLHIGGGEISVHESHLGQGSTGVGGGLLGNMTRLYADGGLVGYEKGGKVGKAEDTAMSNRWIAMGKFFANKKSNLSVNPITAKPVTPKPRDPGGLDAYGNWHPSSFFKDPWNKGEWLKVKDPVVRRQRWALANDDSGLMDFGRTAAYFTPGIGAGMSAGDAATSFGKGDIGGGILNSAFAAGSLWMPGVFKAIGQGLGNVGSFIGSKITTGLGIRGGKNALAALATYADRFYEHGVGVVKGTMGLVGKVRNLTPTLGFNLSDEALHNMLKTGFYGNMRTGLPSSTTDSLMNRIAVEQNMMGIPANASSKQTPAYGFLTTKEDIPVTEGSVWNRGAQTPEQQVINNFNQLINPFSRYLQAYGNNTIKLKPNSLGQATMTMGDSLSVWDQALRLGLKIPGVQKFSSIFSTYPALHGILESTQNLMRKEVPGIKTPTGFPYIEAHLPGGFGIKDIDSIILHPTEKFGPHAKEKIAAELEERRAALQALFDSLGIRDIKIKTNTGMEFVDSALPTKDPSKYGFMDIIKGLMPAPKGTGVEKVSGSKPLMNPNLSLFFKNLFNKNVHGGFSMKMVNGKAKPVPFTVGKRPEKPDDVDPESWNTNWFLSEFFSSSSKKLGMTYGDIFNVKMPFFSPFKMNILDLYPGAKSVAEQYPGLYEKYPSLFRQDENLLNPGRHLDLAEAIGNNRDVASIFKEFGIDAIRHQSGHGTQATTNSKGIFSEVFAYMNPPANMIAKPNKFFEWYKSQKFLYDNLGKDRYLNKVKKDIFRPFQHAGYNIKNFFKDMFKGKPERPEMANGGLVGYAGGGRVKKDGAPNPFLDPVGWLKGLVGGIYAGGGNPSAYLDNTAAKGIKTGAKSTLGFYKNFIFDPTDPVDYAFAAVPGALRQAGKQVAKGASKFGFPLVLQTPKKNLRITPTHLMDEAEGATPGAFRTINGAEHYVKRPETAAETTGELINSTIWSQLGLGGPKLQMLTKRVLASKIIPNLIPSSQGYLRKYIEEAPNKVQGANSLAHALRKYIDEALPTNALLGNPDTHGANILFNKDTKRFENIDLGITSLTASGAGTTKNLFYQELAERTSSLVAAMKNSGFNLRQTNDILKKNGLTQVSKTAFNDSDYRSFFALQYINDLKRKKSLTPQINKISNMLGFDLKKPLSDPINRAATDARTNPFIMDMIKTNPELAEWMKLSPATGSVNGGSLSDGLISLFSRLKEASKNPVMKYAKGGLAIPRFKTGGYVGMMPKFADGGLANLHEGEYVFQKSAVDRIGLKNLNAMNQGDTISGDSVYNYSINVNVKSDANANQIADTVLRQIKQIDSQRLRSVRI
jgi:TP901 family phage tail tape measure protein